MSYDDQHYNISLTFPIKGLNKASKCTENIFKKFVKISAVCIGGSLIGYEGGFFVTEAYESLTIFF